MKLFKTPFSRKIEELAGDNTGNKDRTIILQGYSVADLLSHSEKMRTQAQGLLAAGDVLGSRSSLRLAEIDESLVEQEGGFAGDLGDLLSVYARDPEIQALHHEREKLSQASWKQHIRRVSHRGCTLLSWELLDGPWLRELFEHSDLPLQNQVMKSDGSMEILSPGELVARVEAGEVLR